MPLAAFIQSNIQPIVGAWEAFAASIWPGSTPGDGLSLRDHAEDILLATVRDMQGAQTPGARAAKSQGSGGHGAASDGVDRASGVHVTERLRAGFNLLKVVSEYRALRASVIRLWRASEPTVTAQDLDDLTRFNESIDQSLTEAVKAYTIQMDTARQMSMAILGHDLGNPLTAVIMAAELVSDAGTPENNFKSLGNVIDASARAMSRMIGDLQDFTQAGLQRGIPVFPKPTDFKTLCEEVVTEMRTAHPTHTIDFDGAGDCTGEWDSLRLRQMISNLLGNAIQHGDPTIPIRVQMAANAAAVSLTVHNGGVPIPDNLLPKIFEPFVRGSSPERRRKPTSSSIGLGLYIASEVAKAHGGTIGVTSTEEAGTLFTVRVPRHISSST